MNESIHRYFHVGLIHFMAYPATMKGEGPILDTVTRIAADDYFSAIEITHIADAETRQKVKHLLAQSHMEIAYGAQPRLLGGGLNPNALDESARAQAEKILLDSIDEAEFLGAKGIAFLAGKYEDATQAQSYAQLVKTTKNLCAYAKTKQRRIVLEVFDYDVDKKSLIGPAPLAAEFAAEIRASFDNFGLMIDLSHIPQTHETPEFVIQTLKPYIVHLHIGSAILTPGAEAFGDTHPRFGFPNGVNDVPEVVNFLRALQREGFFNDRQPLVLSFEVKPWKDETPEIVIANAKRVLNRAWALL